MNVMDALVGRTRRASGEDSASLARQRLLNRLDQRDSRRKHVTDLRKILVYEKILQGKEAEQDALMMSAESARARLGGADAAPFVVANSMREV